MTTLFNALRCLLAKSTLLWLSESDYPIEAVRLGPAELGRYSAYSEGLALIGTVLISQETPEAFDRWASLFKLMMNKPMMAYRKDSGKPGEVDLVIVVREGKGFTGIRSKLIET